jgi:hypothetical protein
MSMLDFFQRKPSVPNNLIIAQRKINNLKTMIQNQINRIEEVRSIILESRTINRRIQSGHLASLENQKASLLNLQKHLNALNLDENNIRILEPKINELETRITSQINIINSVLSTMLSIAQPQTKELENK